jgi:AcrR family transcriptional regulator
MSNQSEAPPVARRRSAEADPRGAQRSARERLLAAAGNLFYRRGIRSVGIDEVIAEAGVAKMSLYRCFPSKDDLVAAYLRERDEAYWRWWDETVANHAGKPRDQLRALFDGLVARATRAGWRGCPFTNAATEFPEPDHPGRKVAEGNKQELRRRLRELSAGLGARDADALAAQLVLLFEGTYSSRQTLGPEGPAGQAAKAADALIDAAVKG